jgi:hypothetical protein
MIRILAAGPVRASRDAVVHVDRADQAVLAGESAQLLVLQQEIRSDLWWRVVLSVGSKQPPSSLSGCVDLKKCGGGCRLQSRRSAMV